MNMKSNVLLIFLSATVLGLLPGCPAFDVVRREAPNTELEFIYHGPARSALGIDTGSDEIKTIYSLNGMDAYTSGVDKDSDGRLFIGDYTLMMNLHAGLLIIGNDGSHLDYIKTVGAPIGVAVAGDYLVVGGGTFYPPDAGTAVIIYDRESMGVVTGPEKVQDILWGKTSVFPYDGGVLLLLASHLGLTDAKLQYRSGESMAVTEEWSVETYPALAGHESIYGWMLNDRLLISSERRLQLIDIPLPLGVGGSERVVDFKALFGIPEANPEGYYLRLLGVEGDEFIGAIFRTASNEVSLFKYDLKKGEITLRKDMMNSYFEIPIAPHTLIADNKLYTYSYDSEGWDEEALKVFSLDDFSFIKKMYFEGAIKRSVGVGKKQ